MLVKSSSFRAVQPILFENPVCKKYEKAGRLKAVQIFTANGKTSFLI